MWAHGDALSKTLSVCPDAMPMAIFARAGCAPLRTATGRCGAMGTSRRRAIGAGRGLAVRPVSGALGVTGRRALRG